MKKFNLFFLFFLLFSSCASLDDLLIDSPQYNSTSTSSTKEKTNTAHSNSVSNAKKSETQLEKFSRIFMEDNEKLTIEDGKASIESIESILQPKNINAIGDITESDLSEPGRPYYFKLKALYKGYDASTKKARIQDLEQKNSSMLDNALGAAFGLNTDVYSLDMFDAVIPTLPAEANSPATFYLIAVRITEDENGNTGNQSTAMIRFVRDIEKPFFTPDNFILTNGMHYITVEDAHAPTQQDVMAAYFFGGAISSDSVFDPTEYSLVDLMDARAAMDKKDLRNNYTLPSVKIKYVSEVLFMGQTNTIITVCTDDKILTEHMNFTGRASNVNKGEKVRVYYTICKNPLEEWEIQAIEYF